MNFTEFQRVCEDVTSELFLVPFILLKTHLQAMVNLLNDSTLKVEKSSNIKLASPRVLSNFATIKSTQVSTFGQAYEINSKPTYEEEKLITFFIDNLQVCKFNRMKKRLRGKATLLGLDNDKENSSEIIVCLCGKLLANTLATLFSDCLNAFAKFHMAGILYSLAPESTLGQNMLHLMRNKYLSMKELIADHSLYQ